jgi:hypothetical protein
MMEKTLADGRIMIGYDAAKRRYYLPLSWPHKSTQGVFYCPWCGTKLPKELSDTWFETLEKEYGIDDPYKINYPQEFNTDEWWIKRGL